MPEKKGMTNNTTRFNFALLCGLYFFAAYGLSNTISTLVSTTMVAPAYGLSVGTQPMEMIVIDPGNIPDSVTNNRQFIDWYLTTTYGENGPPGF
jgi:hypothetical protein